MAVRDRQGGSFVKWPGGKKDLAARVIEKMPPGCDFYADLMVGGGAVPFELRRRDWRGTMLLSDANEDLMNAYRVVTHAPSKLCKALERLQVEWSGLGDAGKRRHYDDVRYRFNRAPSRADGGANIERAATFIFLNKTCFNGLWRVDSAGRMNSPIGKHATDRIYSTTEVLASSRLLIVPAAPYYMSGRYHVHPLARLREILHTGDATRALVYFDPPYLPLPGKESFAQYAHEFGRSEHVEMMAEARRLAMMGATVVVSGSNTPLTRRLMLDAGFEVEEVSAKRSINRDATGRGRVTELLATRRS